MWLVKDFADGWFAVDSEKAANRYHEETGAAIKWVCDDCEEEDCICLPEE